MTTPPTVPHDLLLLHNGSQAGELLMCTLMKKNRRVIRMPMTIEIFFFFFSQKQMNGDGS
jgi:hypothetical protein